MIEEDLRMARDRARRWDELTERRRLIADRVHEVRLALDELGAWDQERVLVEETRLDAFTGDLATVERQLVAAGPAREIYEELLAREELRLIESADPRGAELLEIGRLLAELNVELPARERARHAGLVAGGNPEALREFIRQTEALGLPPAPRQPTDNLSTSSGLPPVGSGGPYEMAGEVARWVAETVDELRGRCTELGRMRDELSARREDLLLS